MFKKLYKGSFANLKSGYTGAPLALSQSIFQSHLLKTLAAKALFSSFSYQANYLFDSFFRSYAKTLKVFDELTIIDVIISAKDTFDQLSNFMQFVIGFYDVIWIYQRRLRNTVFKKFENSEN